MNAEIYLRENNLFKKITGLGEDKCILARDISMTHTGCESRTRTGNTDEIAKYSGSVRSILCFEDLLYCSWKAIFFFSFTGI